MKEKTNEMFNQMDVAMSHMLAEFMKNSKVETLIDEGNEIPFKMMINCILIWKAIKEHQIEKAEILDNMNEKLNRIETLLKNKI